MKDDLEEFKKRRDSHEKGYECNSLDYIEDEDCGDLRMVNKGLDSIENSWVLDSALCFHLFWNRDWFDTYKTCDEGLLRWLIMLNAN